jgi:hypothetical protein
MTMRLPATAILFFENFFQKKVFSMPFTGVHFVLT